MNEVKVDSPPSPLTSLMNLLGVSLLVSVSSAVVLAGIVLLLSAIG
jgi:hypothetical protein